MNDILSGTPGEEILSVDPAGFKSETTEFKKPEKGQDCQISLDLDLQQVAEASIGDKIGSVIVLDVHSGEVLVMASKPNYDLSELSPRITNETFDKISAESGWLNRAIQGLYPPGSTFKLLSTIAFLKSGAATWDPADTETCSGSTMIGTRKFRCDNSRAHGHIGLQEAIKKSCNVYFYNRSQKCGINAISTEAHRFGFDVKTGLELPYETSKMIVPTKNWKTVRNLGPWLGGDSANTSIGQGYLRVTPLQMACFTASVARNEIRTIPHIIHKKNRPSQSGCFEKIGLDNRDYAKLLLAFEAAVKSGTCWRASVDGLRIAGKTGTAQVWENGKKRNVAWFIGFAPVDAPQIAIAIALQEKSESDSYYGSTHAAPIAKDIMEHYFSQQNYTIQD
jgi:penicillin-binding protein 2